MMVRAACLGFLFLLACKGEGFDEAQPSASASAIARRRADSGAHIVVIPVAESDGRGEPSPFSTCLPPTDAERFDNRHMGILFGRVSHGYEISTCDPCSNELHFTSP